MTTPRDAPTLLLYLHGFRSSPASAKARRLQSWLTEHRPDVHWWCPQLPASPRQAMAEIHHGLRERGPHRLAVVGSSLGGYYATCVAESTGCAAVVINPAVCPARDLAAHVGEQSAYHDPSRTFRFEPGHLDELRALAPPARLTHPSRLLAVIAKGDELLDWREMSARFAACPQHLIEGSDHGLSDFDDHLHSLLQFLRLQPAA